MKNWVCRRKMDTRDELLYRLLDVAACIKKREDKHRRTIRHLHTRVSKCIEVNLLAPELFFLILAHSIYKM